MLPKITFQTQRPGSSGGEVQRRQTFEGRFGDQVYYTFDQDRCAYLDPDVAARINELDPKPGQLSEICKYWTRKEGRQTTVGCAVAA